VMTSASNVRGRLRDQVGEESAEGASEQPAFAPEAVDAEQLANLLGVSLRHVRRMEAMKKLPPPLRLGRCLRYRLEGSLGVRTWMDAGCPDRATFEREQSGVHWTRGYSRN
jgi:hypothetical protein